jgi:hypothetical protein
LALRPGGPSSCGQSIFAQLSHSNFIIQWAQEEKKKRRGWEGYVWHISSSRKTFLLATFAEETFGNNSLKGASLFLFWWRFFLSRNNLLVALQKHTRLCIYKEPPHLSGEKQRRQRRRRWRKRGKWDGKVRRGKRGWR